MMLRVAGLIAFILFPAAAFGQGRLQAVREDVSRPSEPDKPSECRDDRSGDSSSGNSSSDSSDNFGTYLLLLPWSVPHAAFDPGWGIRARFTPHPYAQAATGHMLFDRPAETPRDRPWSELPGTQWASVRASVEAGSDFRGLDRAGVRMHFDTDFRLGLKTDWDFYRERLPLDRYDYLTHGDITATFRFVQHERIQMHTGLGARLLFDRASTAAGWNALYGFDAFPVQPLHLYGSVEGGTLGDAAVVRLRGGAGLLWKHGEIHAGFDWLRIGRTSLYGPYVGLRVWF
jgi:hypothetical protein